MGMVRVSEEAEKRIKEMAAREGKTFTATVDSLLATTDISARLDKMATYLEKKFEDLEAAIALTSVSSPSTSHKRLTLKKTPIEYGVVRDLFFDVLEDNAPEWFPQAEDGAHASDSLELAEWYTDGSIIYSEGLFGHCEWLKVSDRVGNYLKTNGVEI